MNKKLKILIADDDPITCLDLKELLEDSNYEVVAQAQDGIELIEKVKKFKPDLIITDIHMPKMDGLEALKVIAQDDELKDIPVVMLTGDSQVDMIEKAVNLGVFAYLVKPFTEVDIRPTIQVAINRWKEFNSIKKEVNALKEALEVRKIVETAKGILMEEYKMTESEAFKTIQKMSMNSRKPMKEIAEAIIISNKIKKENKKC